MKFTEPFFGLAYADFDRNSACQTLGKGDLSVRLELPLKGCGTRQVNFFQHKTSIKRNYQKSSILLIEKKNLFFPRNHNECLQTILLYVFIRVLRWTEMKS